jgi:hypothetical protein
MMEMSVRCLFRLTKMSSMSKCQERKPQAGQHLFIEWLKESLACAGSTRRCPASGWPSLVSQWSPHVPPFNFVHRISMVTWHSLAHLKCDQTRLEMATGTRNPSTRRVLPDKEAGMEWIFYPWVCYWAKSYTHRVCGYGCGCILPIPAYPRVRHTRKNN